MNGCLVVKQRIEVLINEKNSIYNYVRTQLIHKYHSNKQTCQDQKLVPGGGQRLRAGG